MHEKIWLKFTDVSSSDVKSIEKHEIYYRKDLGIAFFMAEIDFITKNVQNLYDIQFEIPNMGNFARCESTILATKNTDTLSTLSIVLEPGKLSVTGYPFEPNAKYEMNIQLMLRISDEDPKISM